MKAFPGLVLHLHGIRSCSEGVTFPTGSPQLGGTIKPELLTQNQLKWGMGMAGRCLKAEPDAINEHLSPPSQAGACPRGPG